MSAVRNFSIRAIQLRDNRVIELGNIVLLDIGASLSSPARDFSGVFAADPFPFELGSVTVRDSDRNRVIFSGQIDSQRSIISDRGKLLRIDARSRGALLLDNQAKPEILTHVQMATAFNLFARPYGFTLFNPQPPKALATYTVRAGISEWEALSGYSQRAFGITPFVEEDAVIINRPSSHTVINISNTGDGLRFTRLESAYIPYSIISDIILRGPDGIYDSSVHNSASRFHGTRRRRFIVPSNEFVDSSSLDANQRIRRSMLDSQSVLVTLTGFVDLPIGQQVAILDSSFSMHNLLIGERRWILDENGSVTKLRLISSVYYD